MLINSYLCIPNVQDYNKNDTIVAQKLNERQPHECTSIEEVRSEIDTIDRQIIRLLSSRFGYVREVVKYKEKTANSIEASDRRMDVMRTRRQWAEEEGLNPDVVEDIYDRLVQYFIDEEKKLVNV